MRGEWEEEEVEEENEEGEEEEVKYPIWISMKFKNTMSILKYIFIISSWHSESTFLRLTFQRAL